MARRKYRRRRKNKDSLASSFMRRAVRSILAIVILAAFVLAIAFGVNQASHFNIEKIAHLAAPYLAKAGISEAQIGEVAGEVIKRATDVGIEGKAYFDEMSDGEKAAVEATAEEAPAMPNDNVSSSSTQKESKFKIAIIADTHVANDKDDYIENKSHLKKALNLIKENEISRFIHVGDITNWGVLADLRESKAIMDATELEYYTLPGDRDLAQAVGPENFETVFDKGSKAIEIEGFKFVFLDNSANYTLIEEDVLSWFNQEVTDADFVILSQPVYTDGLVLFNCQYMGSSCSEQEDENLKAKQEAVLSQRGVILGMIRNSDAKAVIAGDHHKSSKVEDAEKAGLMHYVVGAVGGTVNEYSQKSLQSQRFSVLSVFEDGSFDVSEITL